MDGKIERVKSVMDRVCGATALMGGQWKPKSFKENKSRYLWTDAYGVVNFLNLFCATKQTFYLDRAKILIDAVHETLGKTRDGKSRLGKSTVDHPTLGGLRIGKPEDEGSSMNQDGQYFHYLTKWMFALSRATFVTKDPKFNQWAVELAQAVHGHFLKRSAEGAAQRMYWKLSVNLTRPLVPSEGGLDSYDGYVTYSLLRDTSGDQSTLSKEILELRSLVDSRFGSYSTHDPLDAGEALWLTAWHPDEPWAGRVGSVALQALGRMRQSGEFQGTTNHRLAFREFGATIGLQLVSESKHLENCDWSKFCDQLHEFWYKNLYDRDVDITPVMYCSSLLPGVLDPKFTVD